MNRWIWAVLCGFLVWAQSFGEPAKPYLTGATLYISVDDWADLWLNGIPIVDGQRRTSEEKGFQKIQCLPDHLCYFRKENVLAIVNTNAYLKPQPVGDQVGLAYSLHLRFSNGAQTVLSSNDPDENRAYYLPDREDTEPSGWHSVPFDDSPWGPANTEGFHVAGLADLTDPETQTPISFLTTRLGATPNPGERHLYRRHFFLDIGPSPYCPPGTKTDFERHSIVATLEKPITVPRAPPTLRNYPSEPSNVKPEVPTITPTPDLYQPLKKFLALPTFTPNVPDKSLEPQGNGAQTIVFETPPANIYLTFAEGSGNYRLEIRNSQGQVIRHLFDRKVVSDHEEWVAWDGQDDQGQQVPLGLYEVLFLKEGLILSRTVIQKVQEH